MANNKSCGLENICMFSKSSQNISFLVGTCNQITNSPEIHNYVLILDVSDYWRIVIWWHKILQPKKYFLQNNRENSIIIFSLSINCQELEKEKKKVRKKGDLVWDGVGTAFGSQSIISSSLSSSAFLSLQITMGNLESEMCRKYWSGTEGTRSIWKVIKIGQNPILLSTYLCISSSFLSGRHLECRPLDPTLDISPNFVKEKKSISHLFLYPIKKDTLSYSDANL